MAPSDAMAMHVCDANDRISALQQTISWATIYHQQLRRAVEDGDQEQALLLLDLLEDELGSVQRTVAEAG